jgi:hypothetical protein
MTGYEFAANLDNDSDGWDVINVSHNGEHCGSFKFDPKTGNVVNCTDPTKTLDAQHFAAVLDIWSERSMKKAQHQGWSTYTDKATKEERRQELLEQDISDLMSHATELGMEASWDAVRGDLIDFCLEQEEKESKGAKQAGKVAVDQSAKSYFAAYFMAYGAQLTRDLALKKIAKKAQSSAPVVFVKDVPDLGVFSGDKFSVVPSSDPEQVILHGDIGNRSGMDGIPVSRHQLMDLDDKGFILDASRKANQAGGRGPDFWNHIGQAAHPARYMIDVYFNATDSSDDVQTFNSMCRQMVSSLPFLQNYEQEYIDHEDGMDEFAYYFDWKAEAQPGEVEQLKSALEQLLGPHRAQFPESSVEIGELEDITAESHEASLEVDAPVKEEPNKWSTISPNVVECDYVSGGHGCVEVKQDGTCLATYVAAAGWSASLPCSGFGEGCDFCNEQELAAQSDEVDPNLVAKSGTQALRALQAKEAGARVAEERVAQGVPAGWEIIDTGGGCQALMKELDGGRHALATDEGGMHPPIKGEMALVGVYEGELGEPEIGSQSIAYAQDSDLDNAVSMVLAGPHDPNSSTAKQAQAGRGWYEDGEDWIRVYDDQTEAVVSMMNGEYVCAIDGVMLDETVISLEAAKELCDKHVLSKQAQSMPTAREEAEMLYNSPECQALMTMASEKHPGYNDPNSPDHKKTVDEVLSGIANLDEEVKKELESMISGGLS